MEMYLHLLIVNFFFFLLFCFYESIFCLLLSRPRLMEQNAAADVDDELVHFLSIFFLIFPS